MDVSRSGRAPFASAGYHHDATSSCSLPILACDHNLVYWENGPYLCVEPWAHSRRGDWRFWSVLSPREYNTKATAWSQSGLQPADDLVETVLESVQTLGGWEHLGPETICSETMFLGLRLLDGLNLSGVSARTGVDMAGKFQAPIPECIDCLLSPSDAADALLRV